MKNVEFELPDVKKKVKSSSFRVNPTYKDLVKNADENAFRFAMDVATEPLPYEDVDSINSDTIYYYKKMNMNSRMEKMMNYKMMNYNKMKMNYGGLLDPFSTKHQTEIFIHLLLIMK